MPLTLELVLAMFEALRHCDPEATAMYLCIRFWLFVLKPLSSPPPQFIFICTFLIYGSLGYSWQNQIFPGTVNLPRYTKTRSCPTSSLCLSAKITAEVSQLSFLSFQSSCPPFSLLPAHLSSYFRFPNRPFCLQSPFSNLDCKQGCLFPAESPLSQLDTHTHTHASCCLLAFLDRVKADFLIFCLLYTSLYPLSPEPGHLSILKDLIMRSSLLSLITL